MTQEEKDLLLKDLSARLQYGVRGEVYAEVSDKKYDMNGFMMFYDAPFDVTLDGINISTEEIHVVAIGNEDTVEFIEMQQTDGVPYTIDEFKPFLFPLSRITKKQRDFLHANAHGIDVQLLDNTLISASIEGFDWLNKKHFDYRGLIEKGLAIDATGLKIY
jgi:hypothetical protein